MSTTPHAAVSHPSASSINTPPALEVRNAVRHFGGVKAVDGASFTVPKGFVVGLIGPNGAGKSTMVDLICGNTPIQSGSIELFGQSITGTKSHKLFTLGLTRTFQHSSEFRRLSVLENLLLGVPRSSGETFLGALGPRRRWAPDQSEGLELARTLMLEFEMGAYADTCAGELSGGQRRLVEIMRALMGRPKLLVLDEPLAGVHVSNISRILDHIKGVRDRGVTCLMSQGRVIGQGPLNVLREDKRVLNAYAMG
jgi:ABC-type branched-subunit amino acid transport system ATPase component